MDTRQTIYKALLLLEKGQGEQASQLLQQLLQQLDMAVPGDRANVVRCAVILGDYYSEAQDKREVFHWCAFALQCAKEFSELLDFVGYELERASSLLTSIQKES